jgi:cyclic pyranopterin phosphate synthase
MTNEKMTKDASAVAALLQGARIKLRVQTQRRGAKERREPQRRKEKQKTTKRARYLPQLLCGTLRSSAPLRLIPALQHQAGMLRKSAATPKLVRQSDFVIDLAFAILSFVFFPMATKRLTHIGPDGAASMVDVSQKPVSVREAEAAGKILLAPETLALIGENKIAKGNVLATARIAAIQAAKKTPDLIPLCHQLNLQHVEVEFSEADDGLEITCRVRTLAQTGAEMEALTGVSIAALTIYDMCKAVDKTMRIENLRLISKTKRPAK